MSACLISLLSLQNKFLILNMSPCNFIFILILCFKMNNAKVFTKDEDVVDNKANDALTINARVGKIKGLKADEGDYRMFLGVPYGQVNISNPFGHSSQYPPFNTTFEAYNDGIACPHIEEFNKTFMGSLDCLNANIFVPNKANEDNLLPVMVYLFGGTFELGRADRSTFGPKYLVRHNVVVITLNFRLGAYGYMCLDIPEVPGNQGLKDQVLAFRWIQKNIKAFGGDPDKVTVFGNSSGGVSIGLHLISEMEHLFTNAILQSGSAFMYRVTLPCNPKLPLTLAETLGYKTNDIQKALKYLIHTDVKKVIEASASLNYDYRPCIEKSFPNVERFLANIAINSNHSKLANVNVMTGYTTDETLFSFLVSDPQMKGLWNNKFIKDIKVNFNFPNKTLYEVETMLKHFYVGDKKVSTKTRDELVQFHNDISLIYPIIRSIKYFLEGGAKKVYQYIFAYDGNRNYMKTKFKVKEPGVNHGDELGYLFEIFAVPGSGNAEDELIIDRMTKMWTNFAKYSDPTPNKTSLLPVKWIPVTKGSPYHYLRIDKVMSSEERFAKERMTFWDLFYKAYGQYEIGYVDKEKLARLSNKGDNVHVAKLALVVSLISVIYYLLFR